MTLRWRGSVYALAVGCNCEAPEVMANARVPDTARALLCLKLAAKGAMEQGLKKMFGLPRGFALLATDALKLVDDGGEFFL